MFYENLESILKERHSNINQFSKEIGISQATMQKWKTRPNPTAEYIIKIAEYLNVSADYLLDIKIKHDVTRINAFEEQLIENYREADERGKELIFSISKQEAERMREKEKSLNSAI